MSKIEKFKKEVLFELEEVVSIQYIIEHITSNELIFTDKVSKDRFKVIYG